MKTITDLTEQDFDDVILMYLAGARDLNEASHIVLDRLGWTMEERSYMGTDWYKHLMLAWERITGEKIR